MERELGQDIKNPIQREAFLKDNCDACEQKGYMKPYTRKNCKDTKKNLPMFRLRLQKSKPKRNKLKPTSRVA